MRISLLGWVWAVCMVLLPAAGFAQPPEDTRWHLSVALQDSTDYLTDGDGASAVSAIQGAQLRALYAVAPALAVGAEISKLQAHRLPPVLLQRLTLSQANILAKYTLTPNTEPQIYFLAGLGMAYHRADLGPAPVQLKHQSLVCLLGLGQEFALYKSLYGFIEARVYWAQTPWKNFLLYEKRHRAELSAGLTLKL